MVEKGLGGLALRDRVTAARGRRWRPHGPRCLPGAAGRRRELHRSRWSSPSEKSTMARPSACSSGPRASRAASRAAPRSVPPGRTTPGRRRCKASRTAPRFSVNGQRMHPAPGERHHGHAVGSLRGQGIDQALGRLDRHGQSIGNGVFDAHAPADVDHQARRHGPAATAAPPAAPSAAAPGRQIKQAMAVTMKAVPSRGTRPRCASACQPLVRRSRPLIAQSDQPGQDQ